MKALMMTMIIAAGLSAQAAFVPPQPQEAKNQPGCRERSAGNLHTLSNTKFVVAKADVKAMPAQPAMKSNSRR